VLPVTTALMEQTALTVQMAHPAHRVSPVTMALMVQTVQ
jgi:hypothetical protein